MDLDHNPQSDQMAHESMVRTLAAQVRCIWPQEQALFARYGTPNTIIDVGCGSGEFAARLADRYPNANIHGVDIDEGHVHRARIRCAAYGDRVQFSMGDAYALKLPSADLVVCRHVLQALPQPDRVVAQCRQVTNRGGWLHLVLEDYAMIQIQGPTEFDYFWLNGPVRYGEATECDARVGRSGLALMKDFSDVAMDYVVVDTNRSNREDFAAVLTAWRDGYAPVLAPHLGWSLPKTRDVMDAMIEAIRTRYAVWHVPVVSGRRE